MSKGRGVRVAMAASPVVAAVAAPVAPASPMRAVFEAPRLSAADRENPDKLSGEALRELAHKRGMSRTELDRLTDEKIREGVRYIIYRQYED